MIYTLLFCHITVYRGIVCFVDGKPYIVYSKYFFLLYQCFSLNFQIAFTLATIFIRSLRHFSCVNSLYFLFSRSFCLSCLHFVFQFRITVQYPLSCNKLLYTMLLLQFHVILTFDTCFTSYHPISCLPLGV